MFNRWHGRQVVTAFCFKDPGAGGGNPSGDGQGPGVVRIICATDFSGDYIASFQVTLYVFEIGHRGTNAPKLPPLVRFVVEDLTGWAVSGQGFAERDPAMARRILAGIGKAFGKHFGVPLVHVRAQDHFLAALSGVTLRRVSFPEAAAGDRLLAITGAEASYIAGARWVSPAENLFTEALENTFSSQARRVRIIGRQELTPANLILDLDMRAFEARYDNGAGAPPTIRVAARARMLSFPARTVVAEQVFVVDQPAAENRVSAIVAAFDAATSDISQQLVTWTDGLSDAG